MQRVLIVGRQQTMIDQVTSTLELEGYSVSSTLLDDVAVDLATSSDFDAVLIGSGVSELDRLKLKGDVLRVQPSTKVAQAHGPESVVTALRQVFRS